MPPVPINVTFSILSPFFLSNFIIPQNNTKTKGFCQVYIYYIYITNKKDYGVLISFLTIKTSANFLFKYDIFANYLL